MQKTFAETQFSIIYFEIRLHNTQQQTEFLKSVFTDLKLFYILYKTDYISILIAYPLDANIIINQKLL